MRLVIQRVSEAAVTVDGEVISSIGKGLLILAGIEGADKTDDVEWLVQKVLNMRIFSDADGKMNLSVQDVKGEAIVVSQFTLHASTRKGNRPSFIAAARPETAIPLYELLKSKLSGAIPTKGGKFGADMKVQLVNDGPVTIIIDSKTKE